jgi:hypothetical protein
MVAGDPDAAIEARERAHAGYLAQGDKCHAAEMALQLALDHFERLETAIGNGWLGRARRLLEQTPSECAAHGWQAASLAYLALRMAGDAEEALRQARLAQEIGERLAVPAIQALAVQQQGYALVAMGRVEEGLALIDESTVAAVSGELDPLTTGRIYCSTIGVCRDLADWRRAVEWTEAAERWCRRQSVSGFPGVCRVHRAEIMRFRGSWADAEREAKRACEELSGYDRLLSGEAQYDVGEARLRVGDLEGAREASRKPTSSAVSQSREDPCFGSRRGTQQEPTSRSSGHFPGSSRMCLLKRECCPLLSRSGSPLETSTPLSGMSQSSSRSPVHFERRR